ncbi:hypothetical protein B0H17DRAFT_1147681 [Mycena rosella]|uniref:DDE-1 domain-containing protein n=1 Tax=Mycena rosella TaxID=1033263 RepID=A0AAD7CI97_MYCRO|nr:hypothetical protein B0H17DRAFT_1147681 [Mycena rosella]
MSLGAFAAPALACGVCVCAAADWGRWPGYTRSSSGHHLLDDYVPASPTELAFSCLVYLVPGISRMPCSSHMNSKDYPIPWPLLMIPYQLQFFCANCSQPKFFVIKSAGNDKFNFDNLARSGDSTIIWCMPPDALPPDLLVTDNAGPHMGFHLQLGLAIGIDWTLPLPPCHLSSIRRGHCNYRQIHTKHHYMTGKRMKINILLNPQFKPIVPTFDAFTYCNALSKIINWLRPSPFVAWTCV